MARRWDSRVHAHINPENNSPHKYGVTDEEKAKWNSKQDALQYDETPTEGSTNAMMSMHIKRAFDSFNTVITKAYQRYFQVYSEELTAASDAISKAASDAVELSAQVINAADRAEASANTAASNSSVAAANAELAKDRVELAQNCVNSAEEAAAIALSAASRAEQVADATVSDAVESAVNASKNAVGGYVQTATAAAASASEYKKDAEACAEEAREQAELSKIYAENAEAVSDVYIATSERAGLIKGGDNYIAEDGTLQLTAVSTDECLRNSHAGGIKITPYGNTEQDGTTGAQLFDDRAELSSDVNTCSVTEHVIKITAARDEPGAGYISVYYQFNVDSDKIGSSVYLKTKKITASGNNRPMVSLRFYEESGTEITARIDTNNSNHNLKGTIPNGTAFMRLYIYVAYNSTCNVGDYCTYEKIMVSYSDVPWEKFTGGKASPNPEYPQEIKSVQISEIKAHGEQLFDKANAMYAMVTVNGNNFVSGNARTYYVEVKPNTTYTLSKTLGIFLRVTTCQTKPKNGGTVTNRTTNTSENIHTITTGENDHYLAFYPLKVEEIDTIGYDAVLETIMLNEGTEALPLEPYQESTATLSNPIVLNGINDVRDGIVEKDGVYGVERKFAEVVFDGSDDETWTYEEGGNRIYNPYIQNTAKKPSSNALSAVMLCNALVVKSFDFASTDKIGAAVSNNGTLSLYSTNFVSKAEWLAYMSANPITILYELATPTFEPLPTADQIALRSLMSYDGVTYVSCDSEVEPLIVTKYGTSEVGALTLEAVNTAKSNEARIADLTAAVLIMNQE